MKKITSNIKKIQDKEYFDLINQLPLCIKILDLNNNIIFFNNCFVMEHSSSLNIKKPITLNKYLSSVVDKDKKIIITAINKAKSGHTVTVGLTHIPNKSKFTHCKASFAPIVINKKIKYISFLSEDISDRKKIEIELDKERQISNQIINNNPYSIMITDNKGKPIKVNKAFINLFKTKPLPNYNIFKDPVIKKAGWQKQNLDLKKGKPFFIPEILFNPHNIDARYPNKQVWMSVAVFPIMYNKILKNVILMHKDITIEGKARSELKEKLKELEKINNLLVGRELKMIELKKKIAAFKI